MQYDDSIYGGSTITEPVLLELLASPAMQRLKGVMQHGITGLIGVTTPISRFEHSVGAMLLVRRLGADLAEQIAALLHDVSHTAFSHVIDYVFHDHNAQSFHDREKERYVAGTTIPAILTGHGFAWEPLLDEAAFPLLEQPSPALCADRLDYFLRDSVPLGLASQAEVQAVLDNLIVREGRIVCQDQATARWLAETFMAADDASWSNFREVGLYELTAQAIRRGLAVGAMSDADIWGEDRPVWQKLHAHPDPGLQQLLPQITTDTQFLWDEANPTFHVSTKIRTIDPDIWLDGALRRLSELDPAYAARREGYVTAKNGVWPMRVVPAGAPIG